MTTRDEALQTSGLVLAKARIRRDSLSPREAAEAIWHPAHRLGTVDAIEALLIRQRQEWIAASETRQTPPLAA